MWLICLCTWFGWSLDPLVDTVCVQQISVKFCTLSNTELSLISMKSLQRKVSWKLTFECRTANLLLQVAFKNSQEFFAQWWNYPICTPLGEISIVSFTTNIFTHFFIHVGAAMLSLWPSGPWARMPVGAILLMYPHAVLVKSQQGAFSVRSHEAVAS